MTRPRFAGITGTVSVLLGAILSVSLFATPVHGQDLSAKIDQLFAKWDRADSPGCVLAVYRDGEIVYKNVCVACHNADPSQLGSLGPAIAGSSRELLEARVVHGTYPAGYTPKNPGNVMPKFPHLAGSIDALAAYLAEDGA